MAEPLIHIGPEDYELITLVNTLGLFHITRCAICQMLMQGDGGHIIKVTSDPSLNEAISCSGVVDTPMHNGVDAKLPYAGGPSAGH